MEENEIVDLNEELSENVEEAIDSIVADAKLTVAKILKKRVGNELHVANKGCGTIIGIIVHTEEGFIIKGTDLMFDSERETLDELLLN